MRSLSNSRKAQFFILSAFAIVSIIYFISQWMEPYTIVDTSSVVLMEEPFIFNNIKEKAMETANISENCEDLEFNLEEYKNFVEEYTLGKNLAMFFDYDIDCNPTIPAWNVSFYLNMSSPRVYINSSFVQNKTG